MRFIRIRKITSLLFIFSLSYILQLSAQDINEAGDSRQTAIRFNITDKDKNFIKSFRKEDVRIFEDGILQNILNLQQQSDAPLAIGLLVDVSLSQERTLSIQKTVALLFIGSVMHPVKDSMAVVSFTGKPKVGQDLTGDLTLVGKAIEQLKAVQLPANYYTEIAKGRPKPGSDLATIGSTAIWDAIYFSCEEVLAKSSTEMRRAIILITDGEDTNSQKEMKEAVEQAIKSEVAIYAIGVGDEKYGIDRRDLRAISEQTGGRAFFPKNASELSTAFMQIEKELREHYLITYFPQNKKHDGSYRKVRLEIANPDLRRQELRLSYCNRYFNKGQ
jgi:Ca-activated chloride channel homolog